MTSVVFVHVGAPKSGTTYLQNVMWHNRQVMADGGLLYPGANPAAHVWAALDLRGATFDGHRDRATLGAWGRLVEQIRDFGGPAALISQELLSSAFPGHVVRAMADLDFAEVHLVYTARDLARQIPAHWQEDVKNRARLTFGGFVEGLRDPVSTRSPWVREFWRMQDPAGVLGRWALGVPPERVHVVTVPPQGAPSGLLLERFCQVIGVDAKGLDTSQAFGNPSLGVAETELIRRVNLAAHRTVPWPVHDRYVKHDLAQSVLTARTGATRIRLPREHHRWVDERAREIVDDLTAAGYRITGDLDDLRPRPDPDAGTGTDPDRVPEEEVLDAALDALAQLLRHTAAERRRGNDVPDSLDRMREQVADMKSDAVRLAVAPPSSVRDAVRRLIRHVPKNPPSAPRSQ